MLGLDMAYLCTNLITLASAVPDIIGVHQNLNGSHDLTTPLSVMICHPWARTCYVQPAYQIGSLYLRPL